MSSSLVGNGRAPVLFLMVPIMMVFHSQKDGARQSVEQLDPRPSTEMHTLPLPSGIIEVTCGGKLPDFALLFQNLF